MEPGMSTPLVTIRRNPHRRARPTPATMTSALNYQTLTPHHMTSALKPISLFSNTTSTINPNNQKPIENDKQLQNPNFHTEKAILEKFENTLEKPVFGKSSKKAFENPILEKIEKPVKKAVSDKPFLEENVCEKPVLEKAISEKCEKPVKKAVSNKPFLEENVCEKPVLEKAISEKCEKPVKKAVSNKPFLEENVCEKPVLEKAISEKCEKPVKKAVSNKPFLEENVCEKPVLETLKVYLRIKPTITKKLLKSENVKKNVWPKKTVAKKTVKTKDEICVIINDENSVTLCPPKGLYEVKRAKAEIFQGFKCVFSPDSTQVEVFDKMVKPLVDDFIRGKSGMLAALGPSGSGKTHTVFGTPREPGVVPLALGRIFADDGMAGNRLPRTFSLSMFEISEKGKTEKLCDLLQDGGDLCFQQSAIRGLHEVLISDVQQAECLIARGMLRRATAMTNSNSQSSRSQCVINIRMVENTIDKEADVESNCAVLTIVDLAGAEREKKTGNQGARLLESNFINNTSMVFGLCLRSLLEHQKNPTKPLQKHFQSSLLTRYLREYLEGKKRMALILTVKSSEEDYLDSSLLLRQAAPYTKIKFDNAEEFKLVSTKRQKQTMPRMAKRAKYSIEESVNNCCEGVEDQLPGQESTKTKEIAAPHLSDQDRIHLITQNLAKAMWKSLKRYKTDNEVAQNKIKKLTESLSEEKARRSKVEMELKKLKGFQVQNLKECHAVENTRDPEFAIELKDINGEKGSFSVSGIGEQVIIQPNNDEHDIKSCDASILVLNSKKQEQDYQVMNDSSTERFALNKENSPDSLTESFTEPLTNWKNKYQMKGEENKVDEIQVQNLGECHAVENTRDPEFAIELKDINGENGSFSVGGIVEQVISQPNNDVHVMNSCDASILVMNSEKQEQSYQAMKESSFERLAMSKENSPDSLTESFTEPLTNWKNKNQMKGEENKVDEIQVQNLGECHAVENTRDTEFAIELKDINGEKGSFSVGGILEQVIIQPNNDVHVMNSCDASILVMNSEKQEQSYQAMKENSSERLAMSKENSPDSLTESFTEPLTNWKNKNQMKEEENKVDEIQVQNLGECHAVENTRDPEFAIELKDINGEKGSFSVGGIVEQVISQSNNDGHVMNSCDASMLVMNSEKQEHSYQAMKESSSERLAMSKENSPDSLTESLTEPLTNWKNKNKMHGEENKERPFRSRKSELPYKAEVPVDDYVKNTLKTEKISSPCKPSNVEKPKRRLAPASSILLKDLSGLNFEDENKPKGTRGDKKTTPHERNITQGSLSLLRLLNSNLRL